MNTDQPNELQKAIEDSLEAQQCAVNIDSLNIYINGQSFNTILSAAKRVESLEKENASFRKLLTPLKECPQCHGGGWITLSEDGGVPAPCDCWSATSKALKSALRKCVEALNKLTKSGRWSYVGDEAILPKCLEKALSNPIVQSILKEKP